MAISFVASTRSPTSYPGSANNNDTCVINKPSGTASGDTMVAFLEAGGGITFTLPSGWTLVSNYQNASANMTSAIAYKVAGGSEGSSYSFGASDALTPFCGMILTYRGVNNVNPVNVNTESNTGTTGTSAVAAPSATSTALGWYVWFRAGKISETDPTENDFSVSGGTSRQLTSNRGGSTGYFIRAADSNANLAVGSNSGATFTRSGSGTFSGSLARTIVLAAAPEGTAAATIPAVTSQFEATRTIPAGPVDASIPKVTFEGAGYGQPPSGTLDTSLAPVVAGLEGTATGGPLDATLAPVFAEVEGSVNPIGGFACTLAPIVAEMTGETRQFGEHVIRVEAEHRAFLVIDNDPGLTPIKRSQVTDA